MNSRQLKSIGGFGLLLVFLILVSACAGQLPTPAPAPATQPAQAATQAPAATQAAQPTQAAATQAPQPTTASSGQKVTIRIALIWTGGDSSAPAIDNALKKWAEAHKDTVNLVREETPGDEHRNKMTVDLASNNVADVFSYWTGPASMNPFLDANMLLDMSEYFKLSKVNKQDRWTEAQLQNSTFNGKVYALPIQAFKCFTLYNTALFDKYNVKPPTNYQEMLAVAKVFNDNGITPMDEGSKGGNPGHLFYNDILYQLPNGLQDGQAVTTSYNVGTPAFRQAAAIVADLVKNKYFPADTIANGDWPPSVELYNQQKAAMVYTCPWKLPDIKPEVAAISEPMFFPTVDGAAIKGSDFNVGNTVHGWLINQNSFHNPAKQALIVDLMDSLTSDETLNAMIEAGLWPAWKVNMSNLKVSPLETKVLDFTSKSPQTYSVVAGILPTAPSLTAYLDAMDKLFAGDDPNQVIDKFQEFVSKEKK
ncbi:MAG TPA: hypothetical protein VFD70_21690 [Anaerolineae bacterium]|nr:hypothetical protein [Anaerolineae bacterium]